jgi:hypothetical protein
MKWSGSAAGHAGATANLELTCNTDHSVGADQSIHLVRGMVDPVALFSRQT